MLFQFNQLEPPGNESMLFYSEGLSGVPDTEDAGKVWVLSTALLSRLESQKSIVGTDSQVNAMNLILANLSKKEDSTNSKKRKRTPNPNPATTLLKRRAKRQRGSKLLTPEEETRKQKVCDMRASAKILRKELIHLKKQKNRWKDLVNRLDKTIEGERPCPRL